MPDDKSFFFELYKGGRSTNQISRETGINEEKVKYWKRKDKWDCIERNPYMSDEISTEKEETSFQDISERVKVLLDQAVSYYERQAEEEGFEWSLKDIKDLVSIYKSASESQYKEDLSRGNYTIKAE